MIIFLKRQEDNKVKIIKLTNHKLTSTLIPTPTLISISEIFSNRSPRSYHI